MLFRGLIMNKITPQLIQALPKTDLHLHLDGSLRIGSLIEMAKERQITLPSTTETGLRELVFKSTYSDLSEYLQGFHYTCKVLQDVESLERAAYELAWDNIAEGVRYIEVRFAPQLHMARGLRIDDIFKAINRGLLKAQQEYEMSVDVREKGQPPFRYGLIACALRMFTPSTVGWYGDFYRNFYQAEEKQIFGIASLELVRNTIRCRDQYGLPIVGFDLAGKEDGYPARHHKQAYHYAHQNFLKKTVHAGEAYGPESIFDAITILHADRIGHGYHLFSEQKCDLKKVNNPQEYTRRLINYIADRRITVEVCISSNLQTNPEIGSVQNHHFGKMLQERLSATICTDNRLVSHTTVSREIELAASAFDMDINQLRNILIYGFKRSFFPSDYIEKRKYVRKIIDYFNAVLDDHDIEPT